jgi:hypothetical protein
VAIFKVKFDFLNLGKQTPNNSKDSKSGLIFSLALVVDEFFAILQFCDFSQNKSCKTYL